MSNGDKIHHDNYYRSHDKKAMAIETQNGLDTVGHHSNIFHNILKVNQWHILNMLSMFEDN